MAMGKPVIVGDNLANRELFGHLDTAYFCEMNSANSLAEAIIALYKDQAAALKLSQNAQKIFSQRLNWQTLGKEFSEIIQLMML